MTFYADVILPLPLGGVFTYSLTSGMEQDIAVGERVVVPFGKKKIYTGLVVRIHTEKPTGSYEIKNIITCMDKKPIEQR